MNILQNLYTEAQSTKLDNGKQKSNIQKLSIINQFHMPALTIRNPFPQRPWMVQTGAAAGAGSKGVKGAIAGGVAGGIEICITYPTEFVKTQLQLDEKGAKKLYDGIFDCGKKTIEAKGILGLYRGLSVLIIGSIPKASLRFGAFEFLKGKLKGPSDQLETALSRILCGLGAGISEAIFAVTPMETIKVRFINDQRSSQPQFKGFIHGVTSIIKAEGFGGVYKGLTPTIIRQGSNQAIRFYVMETMKTWYRGDEPNKPVPKLLTGAFGAFAGLCSVLGNNPIDVVKTRMQGLEASKYKHFGDCCMQMLKSEGPLVFYKGTVPRIFRVCADVAIVFMLYDSIMEIFEKLQY